MTVSSIEGSESFTQSGKVFTAEGSGNTATQYETKIQFTNEDIIGVVFSTSFLDQYNNIGMATDCTLLISESSDYSDNNTVTITHIEDTQNSYYFFANSAKTLYLKLIYPENCKNSAAARINFLSSIKQGSTTNIEDYISGMLTSFEQESYKPTIDTLYNYYSGCALKKYYTPYEVSADSSLSISLGKNMKYDIQMNSGSSISIDNLDSNLSNSITDINTTMLIRTAHTDSTYTFSNNINTTLCLSGDDTNNNTISLQKGKIYKIDFDICGTYIIGKVTSFNYQLPPS